MENTPCHVWLNGGYYASDVMQWCVQSLLPLFKHRTQLRLAFATAGVSAHAHKNWGTDYEGNAIFVRSVSLVLMVLSIFMAIYAAYNFYNRGEMLQ